MLSALLVALFAQAISNPVLLKERTEALLRSIDAANSPQAKMCESYVGKTLAPLRFDTAAARFSKLTPKGEYETTAAFHERRGALTDSLSQPIVVRVDVDRDYLDYDADEQELRVSALAFGESGFPDSTSTMLAAQSVLRSAEIDSDMIDRENVAFTVTSVERITGSYSAQNAFGAAFRVRKIDLTTRAIFDRRLPSDGMGVDVPLFRVAEVPPHLVGTLPSSPAQAKSLKVSLQLALLVRPKEPYFLKKSVSAFAAKATAGDPNEVTEKLEILIADVQCGFALDAAGKVLGGYPTN